MVEYATIEELTHTECPEDDVQLPSGRWVRVRGLTRAEAIKIQTIEGVHETERFALSRGLLIPQMNEPQIDAWMAHAPAGELNPASNRITELSGMDDGAEKQAVRDFEAGTVSEFRVLPSDQAESNGGGTAPDDEQ